MPRPQALPSPHLLRLALGLIFFHFGFLKFFPDLSPAEMIASQTVMRLTGGSLDARMAMWWLAFLECSIGIGFLMNSGLRVVSVLVNPASFGSMRSSEPLVDLLQANGMVTYLVNAGDDLTGVLSGGQFQSAQFVIA